MNKENEKSIKNNIMNNNEKIKNQMTIIYKIPEKNKNQNKLRLFDKIFVENNKTKCKLIIQNTPHE